MLPSVCDTTQGLQPQKSLKPQTNTSSSNLSATVRQEADPGSPLIASDGDSPDGYFPKMPTALSEPRARRKTLSRIRSYLYGPNPEEVERQSSEDEENTPRKISNVARDLRVRLSQTDSSGLLSPSVGASAASSTSRLYMADTRSVDLDEEEILKAQIKEKVWIDSLAAQNHVSSPIDEDKHPDSVMSPIRRRSLYTPGIATRSPEDILRKPPLPEPSIPQATHDYYYNPALPASSPLSRLANLRNSSTGRSTPCETDYAHLGALKSGTLRVTNGAASPVPRDQNLSPAPSSTLDTTSQDDYYTASDGSRNDEDRSCSEAGLACNASSTQQSFATNPRYGVQDLQAIPMRQDAAVRHPAIAPGQNSDISGPPDSTQHSAPTSKPIKRKPLPCIAAVKSSAQNGPSRAVDQPQVPTNHCSFRPEAYRRLEDVSPSRELRGSTCLHIPDSRSHHGSNAQTFPIHSVENRLSNSGSREDALSALTRNQNSWGHEGRLGGATHSLSVEYPSGERSKHFDSGYSSNISSESFEGAPSLGIPTSSGEHKRVGQYSPQPGHNKDKKVRSTLALDTNVRTTQTTNAQDGQSSLAAERISDSAPSPSKGHSSPEKSRKLQKRRPRSQPPTARTDLDGDNTRNQDNIPPVPTAITDRHSERVSQFPVLEHTYSDLFFPDAGEMLMSPIPATATAHLPSPVEDSEVSATGKRTSLFQKMAQRARSRSRSRPRKAQTPCESDAESDKSEICRSPSWSDYGNRKKKERKKREREEKERQKQVEQASAGEVRSKSRSRSQSRSRLRSWSRGRSSQAEPVPTILDFGTVAGSLGASPYDIARAGSGPEGPQGRIPLHAHQMSSADPCVKSRAGVLKLEMEHSRNRSFSSAGVAARSKQNSEGPSGMVSRAVRPHSMYVDRPSVPAIPKAMVDEICPTASRSNGQGYVQGTQTSQSINDTRSPAVSMNRSALTKPPSSSITETSPCTSQIIPSATARDDSIEDLVDRLLDAPDHEARDIILERIRQQRRGVTESSRSSFDRQDASDSYNTSERPTEPIVNSSAMSTKHEYQDRRHHMGLKPEMSEMAQPVGHGRKNAANFMANTPPMPPLPTAERLQQQEARRPISTLSKSRATEAPKKDLWAGCALETEHKKAIESDPSGGDWESHRSAWSQRRKSAGEALLRRDFQTGFTDDSSQRAYSFDIPRDMANQAASSGPARTVDEEQTYARRNGNSRAFHRPWPRSPDEQDHDANLPQANSNKVTATAQAFERLTG
ncbi:MAG: hypothetical protein Q9174_000370, partial [Haloplaca sp. 1 TL-2023]